MRKLLILFLLLLIAVKVAIVLARGPVAIERDALGYWRLSTLVMQGDFLMVGDPIAYRTPGYPWFLAIVRSIAGPSSLIVIACIQSALSVGSILIAGRIATRITKLPNAMPWTLLVSLPTVAALTFNAAILSETVFVFLLMVNLLAVLDYAKYDSANRAVWVGITFAATLLTRPIVMLLWIPHVFFVLLIHRRRKRRLGPHVAQRVRLSRRVLHAAAALLTIGLLTAPWLLRNQAIFGAPFLTEFVGRNAWVVTFQDGSGAGLDLPESPAGEDLQRRLTTVESGDQWRATWSVSDALVRSGLDDAQADRLMKQVCLDAITENEASQKTFGFKAFRRVCNYWRCAATELPQPAPDSDALMGQLAWQRSAEPLSGAIEWMLEHRWSHSVPLNTGLTVLLAMASLLLLIHYPSRPYAIWIVLILCYFSSITGVLEIPAYRYRMVVEPLVALVIGSAIAVIFSHRRKPARLAV